MGGAPPDLDNRGLRQRVPAGAEDHLRNVDPVMHDLRLEATEHNADWVPTIASHRHWRLHRRALSLLLGLEAVLTLGQTLQAVANVRRVTLALSTLDSHLALQLELQLVAALVEGVVCRRHPHNARR